MAEHDAATERLARSLAAGAGVDWDRLGDYPGYLRHCWRERAQALRESLADEPAPPALTRR